MRKNVIMGSSAITAGLLGLAIAAALTGCTGGAASQQQSTAVATDRAADDARAAELEVRAQQLALREAELAAKEQEQAMARQQAAEAAQRQREAAAKKAAVARSTPVKDTTASSTTPARRQAPRPASKPIEIPAGTPLTVALASDLSTKTAKPGDAFDAHLASDLVINERRVASAGSRLTGTVTEVVSGSNAIGAIPKLSLKFDRLELRGGRQIQISGEFTEQGKSEKGRDTAKILGGAAAGAIIGHQVKENDTGTVVGGLLGGVAGAAIAKKTGTEVQLAAGSTLTVTLDQTVKVAGL